MKLPVKSPTDLSLEFAELVQGRAAHAMAKVNGAIWGVSARERALGELPETSLTWILAAHKGTLEKLPLLLPLDRPPSSLELLSAARNLFENLVWLRLFELGSEWGLRFYGRLLQDEIEDLNGLLSKIETEAELFRELDKEDDAITDAWADALRALPLEDEDQVAAAQAEHQRQCAELDARARRTFSIYAAAAAYNGYGYQAHLLENKEQNRVRRQLAAIEARLEEFSKEIADEVLLKKYLSKFNWREEAKRVGMVAQYDYLYRLTSRLLHSGPMNIVTEKQLSDSEQTILLEYMVIGSTDVLDLIERYDFPGRVNLALFELEDVSETTSKIL
ncbi:hypothetical protein [Rhizobium anhuiense]|uniref:Uncharacterized protein n=1 Tax=Rhizobium anhuiense TaxID=1184720 RepID=A0A3S0QD24_9HYPH|nr:hypothetical protein [Rhizobium anhuiense]RUM01892.1 hypothetical protein EEQ99_12515 [Rhizobium anhuiense]GGD79839.1 hypothetical protein GCM10008012_24450 [Rhizobium anhuiense]